MLSRKQIQEVYIRVCKDGGYRLSAAQAAKLAAGALKIHPLEIWVAMSSFDTMEAYAEGRLR